MGCRLPLRDLIDGVDVIGVLLAALWLVFLMHRIQAQKARPALRCDLRRSPIDTAAASVWV